eukprot:g731.t1
MARRSIRYNCGANSQRVQVIQDDLRNSSKLGLPTYQLITGTPPYFAVEYSATGIAQAGMGGMPSCKQSAPARYEYRGGIEAYCAAAAPLLDADVNARFVVCEGWLEANRARVEKAAESANLRILERVDVCGKVGKSPLFAVYVMEKNAATTVETSIAKEVTLCVRDAEGFHTKAYAELLKEMGIPPHVRSNPAN